jgi:Lsr2.
MAQQVVVVDDITGEAGASTRRLRLDGVEYDIDLTDESFASLQEQLRPYLEKARVVPMSKRGKSSASEGRGTPVRQKQELPAASSTIRAWAAANGIDCPKRGRIPAAVVERYTKSMEVSFTG